MENKRKPQIALQEDTLDLLEKERGVAVEIKLEGRGG